MFSFSWNGERKKENADSTSIQLYCAFRSFGRFSEIVYIHVAASQLSRIRQCSAHTAQQRMKCDKRKYVPGSSWRRENYVRFPLANLIQSLCKHQRTGSASSSAKWEKKEAKKKMWAECDVKIQQPICFHVWHQIGMHTCECVWHTISIKSTYRTINKMRREKNIWKEYWWMKPTSSTSNNNKLQARRRLWDVDADRM